VFVPGEAGPGILTERDVLRAVAAGGSEALGAPAGFFASRPLQSVRADGFIYRAIGRMGRLKIRHLGVIDAAGELVGAVSARDLLRLRGSEALSLGDGIETATDAPALAAAWSPLPHVAEALLAEGFEAVDIAAVISRELAAATRRASELAEASLLAEGEETPCSYAVLVLGSAGRGESLLALDQDNAVVFQSGDPDGPEDRYFASLGKRMADTLDAAGIPYCKGRVMAREPAWRGSIETWHARIEQWLAEASPQDLLSVDIFFDAETVHGDIRLGDSVIGEAHSRASQAPQFVKLLAEASPQPPSAFGLLGGLRTEAGRIDLKLAALLPIVSASRVLAMRHGIVARSTQARLDALARMERGGGADLAAIRGAHRTVLGAILRQQVRDIHAGVPAGSRVEIAPLTRRQKDDLKRALGVVPSLQDLVRNLLF
jgi:DNA polymerase-3 subunit epsilon/CBS domain-containing protein